MRHRTSRIALALAVGTLTGTGATLLAGNGALHRGSADADRTSYAIGFDLGAATIERLGLDGVEYDRDVLLQGFEDAVRGVEPEFGDSQMSAALAVLHRDVANRLAEQQMAENPVFRALAEQNAAASASFLKAFAQNEGARQLPGGIVYLVEAAGEGPSPQAGDAVTLSFIARLQDGTLIGDERSAVVEIDGMIEGARVALTSMRVGDRWIVALPPELAFGLGGRGNEIGPNEAVLAEVELLGIEP